MPKNFPKSSADFRSEDDGGRTAPAARKILELAMHKDERPAIPLGGSDAAGSERNGAEAELDLVGEPAGPLHIEGDSLTLI